jgi:hypothetical protein
MDPNKQDFGIQDTEIHQNIQDMDVHHGNTGEIQQNTYKYRDKHHKYTVRGYTTFF